MGKEKYIRKIEELFRKSPVVSYSSIQRIIKDSKDTEYTKQLVRNLVQKGKIKKLAKGCYTAQDNIELAVFCFKPSYFGLQDALSFHNLWEQETIPVIITPRKVRQGIRNILGMNLLIKRIDKKYFFGFEYKEAGNLYLPYSDIEKTFIDMVYFKEHLSQDSLRGIIKKIDIEKLNGYLRHYPSRFREIIVNCPYLTF